MRIVNVKDIVPGKIFYQVYGVSAQHCNEAFLGAKIIVTSKPFLCNITDTMRFNCIECYETWDNNNDRYYINDRGLGEYVYNLNRLFHTLEDAEEFIEQCKAGVFTDPKDQKFYDEDIKMEREIWEEW